MVTALHLMIHHLQVPVRLKKVLPVVQALIQTPATLAAPQVNHHPRDRNLKEMKGLHVKGKEFHLSLETKEVGH